MQIVPFNNIKGGGVVALLNEGPGQKVWALVHEAGNNTDTLSLATRTWREEGKAEDLGERCPGGRDHRKKNWYRLESLPWWIPAIPRVTGRVFGHMTSTYLNSGLGYERPHTLRRLPGGAARVAATSPGKNGILASSINVVLQRQRDESSQQRDPVRPVR